MRSLKLLLLSNLLLGLLACSPQSEGDKPTPQLLTRDAVGYFCGMIVADHQGPKSQIFVEGRPDAIWFTSVRDGVAFTLLPEESARRQAFYVTAVDLAGWDNPEQQPGAWIEASAAWYVLDSNKLGGMGAAEAIPFASESAARSFAGQHGGNVVSFAAIPESYILGHGQEHTPL